jgi:two-component system, OmpR family, phosphate regulon sensor histidine kinase PhoR
MFYTGDAPAGKERIGCAGFGRRGFGESLFVKERMQLGPGDIRRLIGAAILPPLLVLLLLAGGGWLATGPASIAAVAVILLAGLGIYAWRRGLKAIETQAPVTPPEASPPTPTPVEPAAPAVADRVLQALPDPVLLVDAERHVVQANAAAESQFGRNAVGRDLSAMVRHPALIDAVEAVLEGGGGREVELIFPVPVERVLRARVEPLMREMNEPFALIAFQDMTAAKRTDQMRADFVANVSHELRTPLASLIGFIETLQGPARDDPEAQVRFLAIMQQQSQRMARLIQDLLSLSRIELNEHKPPTGEAELGPILGGLADALALKAAERRMSIKLGAAAPIAGVEAFADLARMPAVQGDRDELTQLFQNLIDNAIKYGRTGTAVRVACWREPVELPGKRSGGRPSLAVAVIDEGEGIAREHLPRLTERFYRVDKARSRDLGGTGLGLAIVKHIVSRHRGRLTVDSTPGVGSVFTVHLPLAEARKSAPAHS